MHDSETGGGIKAVQGDSGHAQSRMVTDVYSHIVDDDRVKTARMLEESFYGKKGERQDLHGNDLPDVHLPEGMDTGLLARALEPLRCRPCWPRSRKPTAGHPPKGITNETSEVKTVTETGSWHTCVGSLFPW